VLNCFYRQPDRNRALVLTIPGWQPQAVIQLLYRPVNGWTTWGDGCQLKRVQDVWRSVAYRALQAQDVATPCRLGLARVMVGVSAAVQPFIHSRALLLSGWIL
jgi:hypothetical protein